jgi:hypothetical protein
MGTFKNKSHGTHFAGGGFNKAGALEVRAWTRWSALRPYSFLLSRSA